MPIACLLMVCVFRLTGTITQNYLRTFIKQSSEKSAVVLSMNTARSGFINKMKANTRMFYNNE